MTDGMGIYGCIACPERFDAPHELRGHLLHVHRDQLHVLGVPP